jgi:hypothetical protein
MSTTGKVKVYKNPDRNRAVAHTPYVPQYQVIGVEPTEYKSPTASGFNVPKVSSGSKDNPRMKRAPIRQPYAEAVISPVGRGKGPVPNVGNNMEHTWSGVDSEIIDDLSGFDIDPNHHMIDNNDYVSAVALGLPEDSTSKFEELPVLDEVENPPNKQFTKESVKGFLSENELQDALKNEYLTAIVKQLDEEEYLLLVDGESICSGSLDYIQEQTRLLVFGEHEIYNKNPVSVDDIIVLKKVAIKIGVFLD